jgi:hypothetical protein
MLTPLRNQYHGRSLYYTQYIQLAISIAVDMRLDRKPVVQVPLRYEDKRDPLLAGNPGTKTWGSEEQRAAAGIFYITSTYGLSPTPKGFLLTIPGYQSYWTR